MAGTHEGGTARGWLDGHLAGARPARLESPHTTCRLQGQPTVRAEYSNESRDTGERPCRS